MSDEHFDAVIVGSGFGGSIMAYKLAEKGLNVCLLERGKTYPPGSFPRSPYRMARNFWDPSEGHHGLFNLWNFRRMGAVVSSGLGGGSLIYSNVLLRKPEETFKDEDEHGGYVNWPVTYKALEPHYEQVERMMNVQQYPFDAQKVRNSPVFPCDDDPYNQTHKTKELMAAADQLKLDWFLPNLAVTFHNPGQKPVPGECMIEEHPNMHERSRTTCRLCGECNVGCNFGSKNTLDYTYLSAARREKAEIRTRCEVRSFAPLDLANPGKGYAITYVDHSGAEEGTRSNTSKLPGKTITADRLILAAGTLGSTFLMLKNRDSFPEMSRRVGTRFSGNGDLLTILLNASQKVNGKKVPRIFETGYGPVITSSIHVKDKLEGGKGRGYYIQDAGFPDFGNWIFESIDIFRILARGGRFARRVLKQALGFITDSDIGAEVSDLLGPARVSSSTLPLLAMGRDVPDGRMTLTCDGKLDLDWTKRRSNAFFKAVRRTAHDIADATNARFLDDPLWYVSRFITVHPVGGCPMGASDTEGVVDEFGQVFNYPGFYITDGSIVPGPVGPNPSLTIAAITSRAAEHIVENLKN
jgi:cholesterol oxidase